MKIRVEHAHAIGLCSKGLRLACQQHGLDWLDIVHNGIDEEVLLGFNDQMAIDIVEAAHGLEQKSNDRL